MLEHENAAADAAVVLGESQISLIPCEVIAEEEQREERKKSHFLWKL
jgi:hypothetical protein